MHFATASRTDTVPLSISLATHVVLRDTSTVTVIETPLVPRAFKAHSTRMRHSNGGFQKDLAVAVMAS
jgi:hypothetical protein